MKKSLKAILFTAATIFAIASFGCKSETNTEYVVRARRFQPHLSPAEIAKNKFN